ncbi:hypothetical protein D3C84_1024260 [compost metagenome]
MGAEAADQLAQARRLVEHRGAAPGVHAHVVPGRHRLVVARLARVIAGADVGRRAGKDHQRFGAGGQVAPLRVGPGEVAVQGALFARVGVEQQRQMAGLQARFAPGHQDRQRRACDLRVQFGEVVDAEGGG